MDQKLILITLLIRLGVAAAIANAAARNRFFKRTLFQEERSLARQFQMSLFVALPFAVGVWIRTAAPRNAFVASDLAYECAILMGVLGGRASGLITGAICSVPALLHGEWLSVPLYLFAGYVGGLFRGGAPNREEIWSFSPMVDLSIWRWFRRNFPRPHYDWPIAFFWGIVGLDILRELVGHLLPGRVFFLSSRTLWVEALIYASSIAAVGIPIKVWNSARIELKLEEQERLLLQARLDALQSQINPHFLFNTLNSISSLVRFRPEVARDLIVKLSSILRTALGKHDAFVRLREEIEFIDNYLDIEVVRFGPEKLRVVKELDPETLELIVPSMLLQPLVENSIKHGLSPKIGGGRITLRSRLEGDKLIIEVEDDGVGMLPIAESRLHDEAMRALKGEHVGAGIGMQNVAERLQVLYGLSSHMSAENLEEGTRIRLELPLLQADPDSPTAASAIYEARSSTRS